MRMAQVWRIHKLRRVGDDLNRLLFLAYCTITTDCSRGMTYDTNCSHHKVNPKIMGHTESGYLFFGGAALQVYQLSKIVQI